MLFFCNFFYLNDLNRFSAIINDFEIFNFVSNSFELKNRDNYFKSNQIKIKFIYY